MGKATNGTDLGKGIDQLPSGKYRLRMMVKGVRLGETTESLPYLLALRRRHLRNEAKDLPPGQLTRELGTPRYPPLEPDVGRIDINAAAQILLDAGPTILDDITVWLASQDRPLVQKIDDALGDNPDPAVAFAVGVLCGCGLKP